MRKVIFFILCLSFFLNAIGQKNKLEIGAARHQFYQVEMQSKSLVDILNIKYQRQFTEKIGVYAQYNWLPMWYWAIAVSERNSFAPSSIGKIINRKKYHYFDIGGTYNIFNHKSHNVAIFAGFSAAYGIDEYLVNVIYSPPNPYEPNGHPFHSEHKEKKGFYLGGLSGVRYDYTFWNNKMNIGPEISARYYLNDFPFQINYGIHLGYSF